MLRTLLLLSIIPAVIIFLFINNHDQEDKDKGFLFGIFCMGALSGLVASLIEELLMYFFLGGAEDTKLSILGMAFEYFCVVAVTEELCKYFAMRILTWNNKRFNSTYDGVVFGVCSALGFATLENIFYIFFSGSDALLTAIIRAFMAVPFHAMCGIIWGYGYGIAKYRTVKHMPNPKAPLVAGIFIAILYHGFYDFSISALGGFGMLLAIVAVVLGYIFVFGKVKKAAQDDELFYTYMPSFNPNRVYRPYVPFYGRMQYPVNYQINNPSLRPGGYYAGFRMPVNRGYYQSANQGYYQNQGMTQNTNQGYYQNQNYQQNRSMNQGYSQYQSVNRGYNQNQGYQQNQNMNHGYGQRIIYSQDYPSVNNTNYTNMGRINYNNAGTNYSNNAGTNNYSNNINAQNRNFGQGQNFSNNYAKNNPNMNYRQNQNYSGSVSNGTPQNDDSWGEYSKKYGN